MRFSSPWNYFPSRFRSFSDLHFFRLQMRKTPWNRFHYRTMMGKGTFFWDRFNIIYCHQSHSGDISGFFQRGVVGGGKAKFKATGISAKLRRRTEWNFSMMSLLWRWFRSLPVLKSKRHFVVAKRSHLLASKLLICWDVFLFHGNESRRGHMKNFALTIKYLRVCLDVALLKKVDFHSSKVLSGS